MQYNINVSIPGINVVHVYVLEYVLEYPIILHVFQLQYMYRYILIAILQYEHSSNIAILQYCNIYLFWYFCTYSTS